MQTLSNLNAPAGSKVFYPDGSSETVSATNTIACPDNFVSALLNAGWEFAATDAGSMSNALSAAASASTSNGLAGSVTRSEALSAGASASVARSSITSGTV